MPNTDTLHALIREYRDARKIPLNVEHRLMLGMVGTAALPCFLPFWGGGARHPSCAPARLPPAAAPPPSGAAMCANAPPSPRPPPGIQAPDYDHLTVIQKVEVFEHALDSTSGEDLHKVLWLKSRSSEVWLERRTAYTRSTAVMSMVGGWPGGWGRLARRVDGHGDGHGRGGWRGGAARAPACSSACTSCVSV